MDTKQNHSSPPRVIRALQNKVAGLKDQHELKNQIRQSAQVGKMMDRGVMNSDGGNKITGNSEFEQENIEAVKENLQVTTDVMKNKHKQLSLERQQRDLYDTFAHKQSMARKRLSELLLSVEDSYKPLKNSKTCKDVFPNGMIPQAQQDFCERLRRDRTVYSEQLAKSISTGGDLSKSLGPMNGNLSNHLNIEESKVE